MSRRLLASERKDRIVDLLEAGRSMRTVDLAQALGVSLVTVRRDLDELEVAALVMRVHGGARAAAPRGAKSAAGGALASATGGEPASERGPRSALVVTDSTDMAAQLRHAGFAHVVCVDRRSLASALDASGHGRRPTAAPR